MSQPIVLFYGTTGRYGCFSNFAIHEFDSPFGRMWSSEQLFMAYKAKHFGDDETFELIVHMEMRDPKIVKALGRRVRNFDDSEWSRVRMDYMIVALTHKFRGWPEARDILLATQGLIAEASPRDRVWGIGMGASNPFAQQPDHWRWQNLLGQSLMVVRTRMR